MTLSSLAQQSSQTLVLRARQLLTMDGDPQAWRSDPKGMSLDALRERDAKITGLIEDGAVLMKNGLISWVGPWSELRPGTRSKAQIIEVDCAMPGWVDCHTHTVFAGWRHEEFTLRNLGASYLDILEAGGGILSTVDNTRRTKRKHLLQTLIERCFEATRRGITTLEIKSGYGLDTDTERKQLKAIAAARGEVLVDLQSTFLGAHVVPAEHRGDRQRYIDLLTQEMIPRVAEENLARFCDVFCDKGAFTAKESEFILRAGLDHGLIPRIHADELSDAGGAMVAASVGAASADHLEFVTPEAMTAMAQADVVAVLLPGVNLCLNMEKHAPARDLLRAGVKVALSTDFNPGTSSTQDLSLVQTLACTGYGLTPGEAMLAITRHAADALRLEDRGSLRVGSRADLTILGVDDYWQVPYRPGSNMVEGVIRGGELMYWVSAQEMQE